MNILNIEHISKIYGEKVIFDDVSLGRIIGGYNEESHSDGKTTT